MSCKQAGEPTIQIIKNSNATICIQKHFFPAVRATEIVDSLLN
jgi:hypothetical protein